MIPTTTNNKVPTKYVDQLKMLKSTIKKQKDIEVFIIENQYEDDHLQCCDVHINGINVSFNYYDDLGFIHYWNDSKKAFKDLMTAIDTCISMEEE